MCGSFSAGKARVFRGERGKVVALQVPGQLAYGAGRLAARAGQFFGRRLRAAGGEEQGGNREREPGGAWGRLFAATRWGHGRHPLGRCRVWPQPRAWARHARTKKGGGAPPSIRPEPEDIVLWHGSGQGPDVAILAPAPSSGNTLDSRRQAIDST